MNMEMLMVQPLFIGTTELILIGGIALLMFGGKKLPEMMRGLGQGVKEFKKGMNEVKNESEEDNKEDVTVDEQGTAETGDKASSLKDNKEQ